MEQHEGAGLLVQVRVPDLKSQTKVVISQIDTIYAACQVVLDRIGKVGATACVIPKLTSNIIEIMLTLRAIILGL